MNQYQELQHGSHHQDCSEKFAQSEISESTTGETTDRESVLDELEKMMFERAR